MPCGACGDLGCLGGLFGSCGGRFDGKFVASIPYYEQLVAELNQAILREHFARVAHAEVPVALSQLLDQEISRGQTSPIARRSSTIGRSDSHAQLGATAAGARTRRHADTSSTPGSRPLREPGLTSLEQ